MSMRQDKTYQLRRKEPNKQPPDLSGDLVAAKDVHEPVPHAVGRALLEPRRPRQALIRAHSRQVKMHDLPRAEGERDET